MSSARSRLSIVSLTAIALGGMWPLISKATGELPQGTVRGKIVGADSAGLRNATVIVLGKTSGGQTLYGQASQTIKADDDGKFEFAIDQSVDSVDVLVSAPGFARQRFTLAPSQNSLNLSLSPGARITGQVLGQIGPAGGLRVKVVQFDRRAERYLGVYTATTKEDGTFTVEDATPGEEYIVSGAIKDFEAIGAPFTERVTVAESATDIGQIRLKKGFELRGVVTGVKLPTSTTIFVHRLSFPDAPEMKLDDRGRFEFRNLPEDSYEVWVKGAGIALSPENASIDPINPAVLCGRINADKSTLKILVDTTSSPKPPNLARLSRERRLAIIEAHRRLLSAPIAGIE